MVSKQSEYFCLDFLELVLSRAHGLFSDPVDLTQMDRRLPVAESFLLGEEGAAGSRLGCVWQRAEVESLPGPATHNGFTSSRG